MSSASKDGEDELVSSASPEDGLLPFESELTEALMGGSESYSWGGT